MLKFFLDVWNQDPLKDTIVVKDTYDKIYIWCITWWCNLVHVSIGLTFKIPFYGESDVIYFKFDSGYYGDPILR